MASLVQFGTTMQCPHGGQVIVVPSQQKVLLGSQPALLAADAASIAGCAFMVGTKPQPCLTVQWQGLATKVKINNQAPLLQTSVGLCKSAEGMVQGTVLMSGVQTKASAT
jgi:hypothetical protein